MNPSGLKSFQDLVLAMGKGSEYRLAGYKPPMRVLGAVSKSLFQRFLLSKCVPVSACCIELWRNCEHWDGNQRLGESSHIHDVRQKCQRHSISCGRTKARAGEGSTVKSTYCSIRGSEFRSRYPPTSGSPQMSGTPATRDLTPPFGLHGQLRTYMYISHTDTQVK